MFLIHCLIFHPNGGGSGAQWSPSRGGWSRRCWALRGGPPRRGRGCWWCVRACRLVLTGVLMERQAATGEDMRLRPMLHVRPGFMTFLFLRFASGVNLYYFVSNLVSIPQQYLLARRRLREQGKL